MKIQKSHINDITNVSNSLFYVFSTWPYSLTVELLLHGSAARSSYRQPATACCCWQFFVQRPSASEVDQIHCYLWHTMQPWSKLHAWPYCVFCSQNNKTIELPLVKLTVHVNWLEWELYHCADSDNHGLMTQTPYEHFNCCSFVYLRWIY